MSDGGVMAKIGEPSRGAGAGSSESVFNLGLDLSLLASGITMNLFGEWHGVFFKKAIRVCINFRLGSFNCSIESGI